MRLTDAGAKSVSLDEIDLYGTELYRSGDPHAAWRTLRETAPVWRQEAPDGTPFWSVTRYRDVVDILRDTRRFSSEHSTMLSVLERDTAAGQAIHLMDPPRHGQVRGATISALSIRVMRRHEPKIRERVAKLVAGAIAEGQADMAKLVTMLPMLVAGELMGIPQDKWTEAAHWTVASMAPEDPAFSIGDEAATLRAAHVFLFSMFIELIQDRRDEPGTDDLISLLLGMEVDGRPATDEEVLVNCYAFIMGANPTIPQASSHLVLTMAENPDLWRRIREADRSTLPLTLEETLRWSSPVNHLLRRTTQEVELGGHVIPEGGLVAAWIGSANRDEEIFADPYTFDPVRSPNQHVAFGFGSHRCIGNSPAQTGVQLLLEELVEQVELFELAGEPRHLGSNFLNGITHLPVTLHPNKG
ncbi:cytochrome P450 [Sphaerisporangium sp. NPDC051017]|uniref:cytochrome P450 n=1 Tax=Sphaerisporangium sp. NPDC051017 TaxID=3154636 RepID=UPI0034319012